MKDAYDVPTSHDFFDMKHNRAFAEQQEARPERRTIMEGFVREILNHAPSGAKILEVGSGYGALARAILSTCSVNQYFLFDYSPQMHDLSRETLKAYEGQTHYHLGNFREQDWTVGLPDDFDVVVTLQTVHELRHASRIPELYRQVLNMLRPGGVFLVSDIVNTAEVHRDHCLTPEEHLSLLSSLGFEGSSVVLSAEDQPLIRARAKDRT